MSENIIDSMIEVRLKEADDFLKVRETLTRMASHQEKIKLYFNHVIFYTNKVDIS